MAFIPLPGLFSAPSFQVKGAQAPLRGFTLELETRRERLAGMDCKARSALAFVNGLHSPWFEARLIAGRLTMRWLGAEPSHLILRCERQRASKDEVGLSRRNDRPQQDSQRRNHHGTNQVVPAAQIRARPAAAESEDNQRMDQTGKRCAQNRA